MENKTKGLIVLDPGHGKTGNPHTTREGFYEGTQNFILANFLKAELEAKGYEVITTRPELDDNPELEARGAMAGENGAILFMSIHSNAPGTPSTEEGWKRYPSVRGVETYYSVTDPENNARIATLVNDAVVRTMNSPNRGIQTRLHPEIEGADYYRVIRSSAASGCKCAILVEHGFHTNPEDSAFLQDSECLARLAKAEAEAIDTYFSGKNA